MRRTLLVLAVLAAGPAWGQENPFADPAAPQAAPAGSPFRSEVVTAPESLAAGQVGEWRVAIRVPPGHYLYAERTAFEWLPGAGAELLAVLPPTPVRKHDTFLDEEVDVHPQDAEFVVRFRMTRPAMLRGVLTTQGCSSTLCYFPQSDTLAVQVALGAGSSAQASETPALGTPRNTAGADGGGRLDAAARRGFGWLLLFVFGAGIATSFTPCVYPMIPITIGIIGARSAGRRSKGFTLSLLYVLGIATTYSILGTTAALTGSLFGGVLQNAWVLAAVAAVFVLMAMSLFGAFELQAPVGVASRLQRIQGSGYPGAFLVGLVTGIVASPCIGPVLVGMLAYVAASGSAALGFTLFFTFALGLGVLFVVLGTFTGVLANLPKSGAWMRWVRIVFGVVFIAVALYYVHPLLPHSRVLLPLGLVLLAVGLGLGGLRHIEETESSARRWRKAGARVALAAGLYAVAAPYFTRGEASVLGPAWLASEAEGRARAQAAAMPLLIDFSADWCVACKELERYTFSDPRVIELARSFVTVRVDATERTAEIRALEKTYGIVGLPWVVFVSPDGRLLSDLTVTGFVEADAMLDRMRRALPAGASASAPGAP